MGTDRYWWLDISVLIVLQSFMESEDIMAKLEENFVRNAKRRTYAPFSSYRYTSS